MINCIILAGGNSVRMTFPKEYIEIEEKYLVHNSIEVLKNIFDDIVIVSNDKEHYKDLKVRVVEIFFTKKVQWLDFIVGFVILKVNFRF